MPNPVSGPLLWQTPSTFYSSEGLTATEYDKIVQDTAFLYAKPWAIAYMKDGTSETVTTSGSPTPAGAQQMLISTSTTGVINNAGASQFNWNAGTFTIPSGMNGLYRVSAKLMSNSGSFHFQPVVTTYAGATAKASFTGDWTDQRVSSSGNASASMSVIVPLGAGATGSPTSVQLWCRALGGNVQILGTPTGYFVNGPSTTSPYYNTFFQIEYLGTSNGAY